MFGVENQPKSQREVADQPAVEDSEQFEDEYVFPRHFLPEVMEGTYLSNCKV